MLELKAVPYTEVSRFMVDFQKRSEFFELPPEGSEVFGAYKNAKLAGYLIAIGYENVSVDIVQGYLRPAFRHKDYAVQFIQLFEGMCKNAGYREIRLCTHNRFRSYLKFGTLLGYKPEKLIFKKVL